MYKIVFALSAEKELLNLPQKERETVFKKIENLANDPRPVGVKKT